MIRKFDGTFESPGNAAKLQKPIHQVGDGVKILLFIQAPRWSQCLVPPPLSQKQAGTIKVIGIVSPNQLIQSWGLNGRISPSWRSINQETLTGSLKCEDYYVDFPRPDCILSELPSDYGLISSPRFPLERIMLVCHVSSHGQRDGVERPWLWVRQNRICLICWR